MNQWDQILKSALMGSQQEPLPPLTEAGLLAPLLAQLDASAPEPYLLTAAAIYTQYYKTAFAPRKESLPLPPAAAAETQPIIPATAVPCLQQLLDQGNLLLWQEWLTAVADAGYRIPPEHLPALLAVAGQQAELRPFILPVIGQHGRWLAQQNAVWRYAYLPTDLNDWQNGTQAARLLFFKQMRQTDPDEARRLLQTTWATDAADARLAFLACLATHLSLADESFLEQCLAQDKSVKVRREAAQLLARLPDAQLVSRMVERARPLLQIEGWLRPSITVSLPATLDPTWERDGIEANKVPNHLQMGPKAWWVCQLLAYIPATFWSDLWGKSPEALLKMAQQSEFSQVLIEGWHRATVNHPDPVWAEALLKLDKPPVALLAALPAASQESIVSRLVSQTQKIDWGIDFKWLTAVQIPWSHSHGRLFILCVQQLFSHKELIARGVVPWSHQVAYWFPPSLADELASVAQVVPDLPKQWQQAIGQIVDTLYFRRQMITSLDPQKEQ